MVDSFVTSFSGHTLQANEKLEQKCQSPSACTGHGGIESLAEIKLPDSSLDKGWRS